MPLRDDPDLGGSVCAAEVERAQNAVASEDGLPVGITVLLALFLPVASLVPGQKFINGCTVFLNQCQCGRSGNHMAQREQRRGLIANLVRVQVLKGGAWHWG